MKTVTEHLTACLEKVGPLPPLEIMLVDTVGCILAEDVTAPFDLPVADLAACDGYAVLAEDVAGATPSSPVKMDVVDDIRAGDVDAVVLVPQTAVKIASGAPLPVGANAVVPVEFTDGGEAQVALLSAPREGENIRQRAEDVKSGVVILAKGIRIGARQVALLAGVGRDRVKVHPKPRVVVLSIGDELVEPGREALSGKVFDANGHALATAVSDAGADTFRVAAVPDRHRELRNTVEDQLVRADLIVTTGGLSYGGGDTVKEVLSPLGTMRFDNVAMWPGRQLGVGKVGEGTPIFCLPGDPVAAQVSFEIFVRPALRAMAGWSDIFRPSIKARVGRGWYSPKGRREFVRVRLTGSPKEGYEAQVQGTPQGLLISALATSNALAVVPESVTDVRSGDTLSCIVLD